MTAAAPCLIGWAQVARHDGEPLDAWAEALKATGVPVAAIDSLDVLHCQSWPYDDPAGRLAARVGAAPGRRAYSGIGGTTPLELLFAAAERIAAGESSVCAVVGGEQLARVRAFRKAGERPPWSHRHPEKQPFPFEAPFHPAEVAHQVFQAYSTFALRDVARRAQLGLGVDEHRRLLGELFAPMTAVAAGNPYAWFPAVRSASSLSEVGPDNRMVAFPYTKRLVAVMDVDLSAAVVLASSDAAVRLGVAPEDRVYLRGWASARDPVYVAEHDELWRSPGMGRALAGALASAGVGVDDLAHADLYSCFPSSVLFALDALGLPPTAGGGALAPFTVTGGLPHAGGPGSGYALLSLAAMAERLRADGGGGAGLVTGVGMHLTKHAAAVLSTSPGEAAASPVVDPGPAVRRPIVDVHEGFATVAAYTVHHGRDGEPTDALLVCDVEAGARCYAVARDAHFLADLEAEEWVGRDVVLADGGEGVNLLVGAR